MPSTPITEAYKIIGEVVKSGEVFLDFGKHRYVRKDGLFFPCVKLDATTYRVKSVLTWDMVEHRIDRVVEKYGNE